MACGVLRDETESHPATADHSVSWNHRGPTWTRNCSFAGRVTPTRASIASRSASIMGSPELVDGRAGRGPVRRLRRVDARARDRFRSSRPCHVSGSFARTARTSIGRTCRSHRGRTFGSSGHARVPVHTPGRRSAATSRATQWRWSTRRSTRLPRCTDSERQVPRAADTTGFDSEPTPSIRTSTTSLGERGETPDGVPVRITSHGSSVITRLTKLTTEPTSKTS